MGWGTSFKTDVYLNKRKFSHLLLVEERLEDIDKEISGVREHLFLMIGAGLAGIIREDVDTGSVHREAGQLMLEIEDLSKERNLLRLYQEFLKENNITNINLTEE